MKNWGPKGIVGINRELRDYLRVGVFPIYGNGGFIVNISKGARMYSSANKKFEEFFISPLTLQLDPN